MKNFRSYKPEGLATSKPNYDKRFGLNQNKSKIKNNLTDCLMRFLFFSRATFYRRCLQRIIVVLIIFAIPQIGCASDRPTEPDRLPFGVFPLNDVRWIETSEGLAEDWSTVRSDTITYSVRQIGENKAELHRSVLRTLSNRYQYDPELKILVPLQDTIWYEEPELIGRIHIEGKKVYCYRRGIDLEGKPFETKQLMYDFGLKIGEVFYYDVPPPAFPCELKFYLDSIDNVLVGNESRKKLNFAGDFVEYCGHFTFSVIEGIGCTKSFFYTVEDPSFHIDPVQNVYLHSVYYKDKLIWGLR